MYQRTITVLLAIFFSTSVFASEYIVKHKPNTMMIFSNITGLSVLDSHAKGNLVKVKIDSDKEKDVLQQLRKNSSVEYVTKNFQLKAFKAPVDVQALKQQWALAKVGADKAWKLAGNKGNRKVIVAVIDTGVDYRHESLRPNMVDGYDFLDNDNDPFDVTGQNPGHGTHCAGVIGATGLVDGGIIGINPEVSIMPIRFLGANGGGDLMAGIRSIDYAIEKGAKVISASWGAAVPRSQAQALIEAVERADKAGVTFVVAAANDGKSNDRTEVFPANANTPNMISVAASNPNDAKPSWSNYGKHSVDISSPGENIMSTLPSNRYGNLSGTSMATPLIAGVVGLLLAQDPTLSGKEVRSLIQSTAAKVNIETACDCRVDVGAAMQSLLNKDIFVVPFAETLGLNETMNFSARNAREPLSFESSNESVASIDNNGVLTGKTKGETVITVTDANGKKASSYKIYVSDGKSSGGGDAPGGGGGGGGECPIGDPALCDAICQIQPDLPFCSK